MNNAKIEKMLELLEEIVNDNMPWSEKASLVEDLASDDQKTAINEFCSWFDADKGFAA